jgi:hypothetical protein
VGSVDLLREAAEALSGYPILPNQGQVVVGVKPASGRVVPTIALPCGMLVVVE